jgi:hypothetical protein
LLQHAIDDHMAAMEIQRSPDVSAKENNLRQQRVDDSWHKVSISMSRLKKIEEQLRRLELELKK